MAEWDPVVVLVNASVPTPIEMNGIAIVPGDDDRLIDTKRRVPKFGAFLDRFTDEFGEALRPNILVVRQDFPASYRTTSAIAGFRDAIAISSLPIGRASLLANKRRVERPIWGECLALYPWMIDRDGEDLYANTQSMLGVHVVEKFRGQSTPGFASHEIQAELLDAPVFSEISTRWKARFRTDNSDWKELAVFRSLNMAYQACMMPGGQEATFYDVGRLISLWVSACEILVHPGPGGASGKIQVMDALDNADWIDPSLTKLTYPIGKPSKYRTASAFLYFQIDALRSSFLHGNEVSREQLQTPTGSDWIHVAACLYRMLLASDLNIFRPNYEDSRHNDSATLLKSITETLEWKDAQRPFEKAISDAANGFSL